MAATKKKRSAMPVSKAKTAYELLAEIRKLILEEPLRYNQEATLMRRDSDCFWRGRKYPSCGTIGCVAGWTVAMHQGKVRDNVLDDARIILGLNSRQAADLFSASAVDRLAQEKDPSLTEVPPQTKEHARVGAAHIARFMQKHAKQLKAKTV